MSIHQFYPQSGPDLAKRQMSREIMAVVNKNIHRTIMARRRRRWLKEAGATARAALKFLAVVACMAAVTAWIWGPLACAGVLVCAACGVVFWYMAEASKSDKAQV